ncbi:hypothetical protein [Tritonibacter mobilis]|uniref:hypothetical protein n=1 Tax=Tritonibacter mobilis TaxID=379347 RepID=UPI000E0D0218|nr:hypothetical protein [Tritonibacter mobilis]NHM19859.1 hypothetical protein [Tritonibacter mobilis]NHM24040.1 hypothetical protein [Tritonibacter mobilis]
MIYAKASRLVDTGPARPFKRDTYTGTKVELTGTDRRGLEQLLRRRGPDGAKLSPLLSGLIRHKLRIADTVEGPAPNTLVSSGRLITYKIGGENARSGILTMSTMPFHGTIPVGSLLGATLIGLRRGQKTALLQEDREIGSVVVLEIDLMDAGPTIP